MSFYVLFRANFEHHLYMYFFSNTVNILESCDTKFFPREVDVACYEYAARQCLNDSVDLKYIQGKTDVIFSFR